MKKWIIDAHHAQILAFSDNETQKAQFLVRIGSNPRLAGGVVSVTFKKTVTICGGGRQNGGQAAKRRGEKNSAAAPRHQFKFMGPAFRKRNAPALPLRAKLFLPEKGLALTPPTSGCFQNGFEQRRVETATKKTLLGFFTLIDWKRRFTYLHLHWLLLLFKVGWETLVTPIRRRGWSYCRE